MHINDMHHFFNLLPQLGIHMNGKSQAGREHFTLDAARQHFKQTMADPLPVQDELLASIATVPCQEWLGKPPTRSEVEEAFHSLRRKCTWKRSNYRACAAANSGFAFSPP